MIRASLTHPITREFLLTYRFHANHVLSLFILILAALLGLGHLRSALQVPAAQAPAVYAPDESIKPLRAREIPVTPVAEEKTRMAATSPRSQEDERQEMAMQRASLSSRGTRPEPLALPRPLTATVPILMYHHIADIGPTADAIRRDLSVSPANFEAQLSYLARHSYHTISLADLLAHLEKGQVLPPKSIVLTFDDGYQDNYAHAFRLLKQYGFSGTFFIITDLVGRGEYMSWDQAREMHAGGMDLESHTVNHPDLSHLTAAQVTRQLVDSRAVLESRLGKTVRYLCYPSGRYSPEVIRLAQQAGYLGAVTTVYGDTHKPDQPFELARVRMRGSDSLEIFAYKVRVPEPKTTQPNPQTTLRKVQ